MNLPVVLAHYAVYGAYFGVAEQLSLATGALIVYAAYAGISRSLAARLSRIGQTAFGVCTLFFGGAHFIYMNLTAPLVPKWLPPNQVFWGYATGLAFLAAGASLVTRLYCRLAAILLAVMLALFALLVHAPMLLVDRSRANWTEAAINFAILAVAWVMADALVAPRPPTSTDSGRATSPADGQ
jgi:hypothetical protein